MATELCFFGPSHSGKTTLAVKMANYLAQKHTVILLFCDRVNPPIPWLFPRFRAENLKSITTVLSAVEMTEEKIMHSVTVGKNANLLYLGYGSGENLYSFPAFGTGRAEVLLNNLGNLADYIVTDCMTDLTADILTETVLKRADGVFRLYTPDLSSFSFYDSQLPLLSSSAYRAESHIKVLNCTSADVNLPETEAAAALGKTPLRVPYVRTLRQQTAEGCLAETGSGKKITAVLQKMAAAVTPKESL